MKNFGIGQGMDNLALKRNNVTFLFNSFGVTVMAK